MGAISQLVQVNLERTAMLWMARQHLRRPLLKGLVSRLYTQYMTALWLPLLCACVVAGLMLFQWMPKLVDSAATVVIQRLWSGWIAVLVPLTAAFALGVLNRRYLATYLGQQTDSRVFDYLHHFELGPADYPGVGWLKAAIQVGLSCAIVLIAGPLGVGVVCLLITVDQGLVSAVDAAFRITSPTCVIQAMSAAFFLSGLVALIQLLGSWSSLQGGQQSKMAQE